MTSKEALVKVIAYHAQLVLIPTRKDKNIAHNVQMVSIVQKDLTLQSQQMVLWVDYVLQGITVKEVQNMCAHNTLIKIQKVNHIATNVLLVIVATLMMLLLTLYHVTQDTFVDMGIKKSALMAHMD